MFNVEDRYLCICYLVYWRKWKRLQIPNFQKNKNKKELFLCICRRNHFEPHPGGCQNWTTKMVVVPGGLPTIWIEICRGMFIYENVSYLQAFLWIQTQFSQMSSQIPPTLWELLRKENDLFHFDHFGKLSQRHL